MLICCKKISREKELLEGGNLGMSPLSAAVTAKNSIRRLKIAIKPQ